MWTKPGYQPEQPARQPVEPSGLAVATFERPGKGRNPDAELRLTIEEYQGSKYLGLRVWNRGQQGWFPTKRGCSIRLGEAENLAESLLEAVKMAHTPAARPARSPTPQPRTSARSEQRPSPQNQPRQIESEYDRSEFAQEFDEFA